VRPKSPSEPPVRGTLLDEPEQRDCVEPIDRVIEQLRERERDHREVDAGDPDREVADEPRDRRTDDDGERDGDDGGLADVDERDRHDVRAESPKQRVAERHQTGVTHNEVEREREQPPQEHPRHERDDERGVEPARPERHECQQDDHPDPEFDPHLRGEEAAVGAGEQLAALVFRGLRAVEPARPDEKDADHE